MEVRMIKTEELIPYENNPRFNEEAVEYVAKSIKEFGFKVPIVIDKNNVIVAGHTRLKAAKELGLEEVPCIIADDLTEDQIKAYRLADNKVSEKSSWDYDLLDIELEDIDFDMEEFGFDKIDIDWDNVEELSDTNYEEPTHRMLECPKCHHIDRDIHFKKVDVDENTEAIADEE